MPIVRRHGVAGRITIFQQNYPDSIPHHHCSRRVNRCLSPSGPGFDPRSGQFSWLRFFRGFSSTAKTNVRKT